MKIILSGAYHIEFDINDDLRKVLYLQALKKVESKFPDKLKPGALGRQDGTDFILQRGFRDLVGSDCKIDDVRNKGPQVEIYLDESKLDARSKYQKPLVEEVLAKGDEGVLVSPTGSGKTVMEVMIAAKLQRRTLVLTHTRELADQIRGTFKNLTGIEPGFIGAGVRDVRPITVGLIQSVRSYDEILGTIGLLLIDEAHHISAPTYLKLLENCPARYRYGLTATIKKTGKTEEIIFRAIGPVLGEIKVGDLQGQGHLNTGIFRPIYTTAVATRDDYVCNECWYYKKGQYAEKKCPSPCTYPQDDKIDKCVMDKGYYSWVYKKLSADVLRNERIITEAVKAVQIYPWTIVLTHLVDHAFKLHEAITKAAAEDVPGVAVHVAVGSKMKKSVREAAVEAYRKKGGILIATSQALGEGFDAPKTGCLVRAMPAGGMVSVRQQTGRIMRPQEKPSLIIDFVDRKVYWLNKLWLGRRSIYGTIGFKEEKAETQGEFF